MKEKYNVGILGATGIVGNTLLKVLENHPWFNVTTLFASNHSSGKTLETVLTEKHGTEYLFNGITCVPNKYLQLKIQSVESVNYEKLDCDFVFSALNGETTYIKQVEENFAKNNISVISLTSAHRYDPLIPMIIPEINAKHLEIIPYQKQAYGYKKGFIVTKSNCTLQSFLPPLFALNIRNIQSVYVTTMQAVSGTGKTLKEMPEIEENLFPYIFGEEFKTENEPKKILGKIKKGKITEENIKIHARCFRVPVEIGHTSSVFFKTKKSFTFSKIVNTWNEFKPTIYQNNLPSVPRKFLNYKGEPLFPQPKQNSFDGNGMTVSIGNLRAYSNDEFSFTALSNNLIRGASGGAVLLAEIIVQNGYLD